MIEQAHVKFYKLRLGQEFNLKYPQIRFVWMFKVNRSTREQNTKYLKMFVLSSVCTIFHVVLKLIFLFRIDCDWKPLWVTFKVWKR